MFRRVRSTFSVQSPPRPSGHASGTPLHLRSFHARIHVRTVAVGPDQNEDEQVSALRRMTGRRWDEFAGFAAAGEKEIAGNGRRCCGVVFARGGCLFKPPVVVNRRTHIASHMAMPPFRGTYHMAELELERNQRIVEHAPLAARDV